MVEFLNRPFWVVVGCTGRADNEGGSGDFPAWSSARRNSEFFNVFQLLRDWAPDQAVIQQKFLEQIELPQTVLSQTEQKLQG